MNPFEIDDLRRYIFSFLRKTPHKQCPICTDTLEWNPGKTIKKYVEWGPPDLRFIRCNPCYRTHFFINYDGCSFASTGFAFK